MFENSKPDNDKRGQVGIGTLIVFIAMVLVAAIAAGVLVNTAGLLQSTAEDTGEQSVEKVTNRVEVINAYGDFSNADESDGFTEDTDGVQFINLNLRIAAGSDNVNLNDATIRYLSDSTASTLTHSSVATTSQLTTDLTGSDFMVSEVKDDDSSMPVFNDKVDRFEITIDAGQVDENLQPGTTVELEVTTKTGGTTLYIFTTPDSYAGVDNNDPVAL